MYIRQRIARGLVQPLNTPMKRAAALALGIGIVLVCYSIVVMENDCCSRRDILDNLWKAATRDRYTITLQGWGRTAFWGIYFSIAGFFMSYGYDRTVGKVVRWVRLG